MVNIVALLHSIWLLHALTHRFVGALQEEEEIDQRVQEDAKVLDAGHGNQPWPQYTSDYFSGNIPSWSNLLLNEKNSQLTIHALEVGCFEGRASVWLLENLLLHQNSTLTAIDTFAGPPDHSDTSMNFTNLYERYVFNIAPYQHKVTILQGASSHMLKAPEILNGKRYHLIYIDAAHRARNVLEDTILAFPLLNIGGVMLFDDYLGGGDDISTIKAPKAAIDAFLQIYHGSYRLLFLNYQVAILKTSE